METTLTMVCKECNNYFIRSVERGTFAISEGIISLGGTYLVGQYVRLAGSILNDGVYKLKDLFYTLDGATDEEFSGVVCGLAIPADFIDLVSEIDKQITMDKNDKSNKGLTSEGYAGYNYNRATNAMGVGANWKEIFASQLNAYRRMFPERVI